MKRGTPQILIPHFRGLSDLRGRMRDRGYSPHLTGVIDRRGGNLNRLGGSISATSGPHASIWGINQLQFQTGWNFAVNDGEHRKIYEQGLPWEGLDLDNHPDWHDIPGIGGLGIEHPDPNFEHPQDGKNHDPRRHPSICHSWWDWRYGEWHYPVTDFRICQTTRAISLSSNMFPTVAEAVDGIWDLFRGVLTQPMGTWSIAKYPPDNPALQNPLCQLQAAWSGIYLKYQVTAYWRAVYHRVCSNTIANPPTPPAGGEYTDAYYSGGNGMIGGKITGDVGKSCAACTGTTCDDLCTDIFMSEVHFPNRGEVNDADVAKDFVYHYIYGPDEREYDGSLSKVWLIARGGLIAKHDEFCFGEK